MGKYTKAKKAVVIFKVDEDTKSKLVKLAEDENKPLSVYVREAVTQYLERRGAMA